MELKRFLLWTEMLSKRLLSADAGTDPTPVGGRRVLALSLKNDRRERKADLIAFLQYFLLGLFCPILSASYLPLSEMSSFHPPSAEATDLTPHRCGAWLAGHRRDDSHCRS